MQVLVSTLGSPSHGRAQLPVLRALAAAGHRVTVATTPALLQVFAADDLEARPVFPDFTPATFAGPALAELAGRTDLDPEERGKLTLKVLGEAVSGPIARMLLEHLRPLVDELRPQLLLRDGMDLATVLLSEQHGIPQLPTPSGSNNVLPPAATLEGLNALRTELELPTSDDPLAIAAHGRIDYVPPAFSYARHLPASYAYRQTTSVERSSVLPAWVAELPTDRPLVFAALGTALPAMAQRTEADGSPAAMPHTDDPRDTIRTVIEAASLLTEATVIVATAGLADTDIPVPDHVHLTERLPQPILLEAADLFLTHGGFNSVRESLRTGTPTAVLPQFGDQFANAQRSQELGVGRQVTDRTAKGIAATCREVLADTGIQARARAARLAMLALPEVDAAVADLEKLAC